jgi:hypothetical protein
MGLQYLGPAIHLVPEGAALNLRVGRLLTDLEWVRTRAMLVELMSIVRTWDQRAKMSEHEADNVVVVRQSVEESKPVQELQCQQEL